VRACPRDYGSPLTAQIRTWGKGCAIGWGSWREQSLPHASILHRPRTRAFSAGRLQGATYLRQHILRAHWVRVEARLCELAGHLAAATCRLLVLLFDFDARRGWAGWEMRSCAAWLSWKCQLSSGAAREHVRVARALTRVASPATEPPDRR
jgi:hypothetical protein